MVKKNLPSGGTKKCCVGIDLLVVSRVGECDQTIGLESAKDESSPEVIWYGNQDDPLRNMR